MHSRLALSLSPVLFLPSGVDVGAGVVVASGVDVGAGVVVSFFCKKNRIFKIVEKWQYALPV